MDKDKNIEVWPFLDWSLVQAGRVEFIDYGEKRQLLPSPKLNNVPYGIEINSQEAKKTAIWLKAEKPWEAMEIGAFLTVIYEDGIYRLWYWAGGPDYHDGLDSRLCYAESSDGFNWKKPNLNLIEYEGDKRTNIIFDKKLNGGFGGAQSTGVFLDPIAPPSERYKMLYCSVGENKDQVRKAVRGAVSKDGLLWKPIPEPVLDNYMSDTQIVAYYDRKIEAYVGYFRSWTKSGFHKSYFRRSIARATTKDFRKWPIPETVLSLGVNYHPSHDLYTNAHVLYPDRDDLHLFFPAQYDREKDTLEIYLATSRDGVRLEYFGNNPVVPLGAKGSPQEASIYAGCGLVQLGKDNLALPCCGDSTTHNDSYMDIPHQSSIPAIKGYQGVFFWATWKKDRLVAIEATEEGSFSFPSLTHRITNLYLNFITKPAGEIRVQISNEKGKPVPGYSFSDCTPICGDELRYRVSWRGKTEILASEGKPIVVQFKMRQAKLFAVYLEN